MALQDPRGAIGVAMMQVLYSAQGPVLSTARTDSVKKIPITSSLQLCKNIDINIDSHHLL